MLPGSITLVSLIAAVALALALVSQGPFGVPSSALLFVTSVSSAAAISSSLALVDKDTIASFRRSSAVVFAGLAVWLACAACGWGFARLTGSAHSSPNSMIFGSLLCAGFEFLVIRGAFTTNGPVSLVLSAILPSFGFVIVRPPGLSPGSVALPLALGLAAFAVIALFLLGLKRKETAEGFDAVRLFQAFMKAWAGSRPSSLESIISAHSKTAEVSSKAMLFRTKDTDIFVVIPGVHPGPFHMVGSYDLPDEIRRAFKELGPVLTLHGPGGHERNLATTSDTRQFAGQLGALARQISVAGEPQKIRGPTVFKLGATTVTTLAFARDVIVTVTSWPAGSDDLDSHLEASLNSAAIRAGVDARMVDAHNSIGHYQPSPQVGEEEWLGVLGNSMEKSPEPLRVSYSSSREVGLTSGGDITENGLDLVLFEVGGSKKALVLADANNAVSVVRSSAEEALKGAGYSLIEFCTSDSHRLAASGLTVSRGYKALGEETPPDVIAGAVVRMARLADSRLSACAYSSATQTSTLRVFGEKALNEFAEVTSRSSKFARIYTKFAVASIAILLILSLLL